MVYLVTGGSGFIGSHLTEQLLKNGHSVINIDSFDDFYDYKIKIKNTLESVGQSTDFEFTGKNTDILKLVSSTESDRYILYHQDIRDKSGLENIFSRHPIDMVIHLAALAGVRPSIERPLEYEEVNIRGTMNLWELCREFGIKNFICASSSSVYGNNEKIPFAETDPVDHPISPYAATKKCGEVLGHVYHQLYGINMIQLRFFTVYGPRQRPDLAIHKFTRLISEGMEIPFYGDGTTARDYTYIDDIIDGILKSVRYLETHSGIYEILNLGESQVITLSEMLSAIEDTLGKKARKKRLPMQPGDVQKTNADISKAKALIGYKPDTDFQNGIKKFVEWFLRK
ncbi:MULTISPECIES: GDP-mannose 4,6-dehydratase [Chryseobacterium]|uniref:UDP-glucuronate 4-epimerase n=1 Tax=Chryseobacterium camelliae TaxID=1265445 RepID=A0ABU0TMQ0_9FLAO|nr:MULTISPECIES: GDP-mannose 4,6-dehydratase [Chryseobacterium]MDT3407820.1 UDP-glucuronate 4-epimerase [Pseudacidovorax intermedius]MDQ1098325.1 UDP-glucuronate 4-epimerase [Chryseobacterium camelliae]MDQ1102249.1 UDP-glucuronate 4-epimerase [Chryseobacterium sp. SORGH_AS_1048]MDR6085688.1 UDP-glucuronate 4-epimerase [Chryseobacterium sp. SORGH_AS_0909]MDR6130054.1 UDP-glucuronate 4-epimerase [Chryseobacterium sp. SORGH_AS_1175]